MSKETPALWGLEECESLSAETLDEAVGEMLDGYDPPLPAQIEVCGYDPMDVTKDIEHYPILQIMLEHLDEEYGNPDGPDDTSTPAMVEAERAFREVIKREYRPWGCQVVCRRTVDVAAWVAEHRPDWLAEGVTIETAT
jgi:hypothetical protein